MSEKKSFLQEIHYFRLPASDLDASVRWYADVLGLPLRRQTEERAVFEVGDGPLLVIVKADADSRGHFHVDGMPAFAAGFACSDIHRFREVLIERGARVEEMQEDEGHFYFHFYDPTGNKLQAHW